MHTRIYLKKCNELFLCAKAGNKNKGTEKTREARSSSSRGKERKKARGNRKRKMSLNGRREVEREGQSSREYVTVNELTTFRYHSTTMKQREGEGERERDETEKE
jgi:hypothetical protein